ncbi:MAG: ABC transporter permease [Acidobacteriota bacterium]|nr:ABC transporter permease [Acidobacteriota bacterium]OQB58389.1 MAG: Macrolide export ATP-binding/permease protein MacB [Candidatus Aminicenantes bacterium ADurb.Bin147]HNQ80492.1 ABC transporter permease [Candidatus Aminicenantes bacterium]MDD8033168.1 ABC transporter permease [Acidobacteriota bacterium]MDD8038921.1 ABC transporter permease [Acidobacteriota bacterium]
MAKINFGESLSLAFSSLWESKLRTFLTLLGIIIGVLTIITVVSVIQGLNNYVYTKMAFFGANDFSVSKFSSFASTVKEYREQMKRRDLTLEDVRLLREKASACELIGASDQVRRTVKFGSAEIQNAGIIGVTAVDHLIGSVIELESGRHLLQEEEDRSRFSAVIGSDVAEKLFPRLDPVGRTIKVGADRFRIVGVGKKLGKILGMSRDNYVRVPITTFLKTFGSRRSLSINIHTSSPEAMARAQDEVRTILRSKRKLSYDKPDDFSFQTSETFIQFYKTATNGIYFAMIGIASIALLVGGIVVMNIMLVAVTERTKEIGIRMAIGARRKDILVQFLIESSAIAGVGGLIGIVLGVAAAKIISAATSLPSAVDPGSVIAGIVMSATLGLFFGIYPANKAAKLDPVVALRSET